MDTQAQGHETDQFETLIAGLIDQQYGCIDDFMDVETILGLRNNIQRITDAGEMHAAGMGDRNNLQLNRLYRGDRIKWLEAESNDQFEILFTQKIDGFINYLNKTCYTSIATFESHYASYEQNSCYKRHLDRFKTDNGRKYSVILYLNDNWLDADGGTLALYPKEKESVAIYPLGGRLAFFKSDEMEHEVKPSTTRERVSIAGWMK